MAHWQGRPRPPSEQAIWAWIALRHEIDYRRPLLPGETAQARTWVAGGAPKARSFDRFIRIDGPGRPDVRPGPHHLGADRTVHRPPAPGAGWITEMFT